MPDTAAELWGIQHIALLTGANITNVRDAKSVFGPEERGLDVVFDFAGCQIGAQHTVLHPDEGQTAGKRGSALRAQEEALARATQRPFGMCADYRRALLLRINEKIAIAARHDNRHLIAETWLIISAQLNRWGALASTTIVPGLVNVADLNSVSHAVLTASTFDQAYLVVHTGKVIYGWSRDDGWRVVADPDAGERQAHKDRMNSLISSISSRW